MRQVLQTSLLIGKISATYLTSVKVFCLTLKLFHYKQLFKQRTYRNTKHRIPESGRYFIGIDKSNFKFCHIFIKRQFHLNSKVTFMLYDPSYPVSLTKPFSFLKVTGTVRKSIGQPRMTPPMSSDKEKKKRLFSSIVKSSKIGQ